MNYLYFGQDADGNCYADNDEGERIPMDRKEWLAIIHAASVPSPVAGHQVRMRVVEEVKVEVFEDGTLVRTVELTPDITEI